jgi:hypothetical protein
MVEGEGIGGGWTITSLASARDVAWASARCLSGLRSQMRAVRWAAIPLLVVLGLLAPPSNAYSAIVLLVGVAVIWWMSSTDGLARYDLLLVRRTPSLTTAQTISLDPGGVRFLDHESDRRYAWHHWQAVHDLPEGIALELRGGWQADLLHVSAFTSPTQRADWLAAIRDGIGRVTAPPG